MQDSHEECKVTCLQVECQGQGGKGRPRGFKQDGLGTLVIWPTVSSFRIGGERGEDREEKESEGERRGERGGKGEEEEEDNNDKVEEQGS